MTCTRASLCQSTTIYRTPDNIDNLRIRIKLCEIQNDIQDDSEMVAKHDIQQETKVFWWQEKVHSRFEREFYKDRKNCVTDLEKRYHENVIESIQDESVLFTYVNEDELSLDMEETTPNTKMVSRIYQEIKNSAIGANNKDIDTSDLAKLLVCSCEYQFGSHNFEIMYIMADFGEYVGDSWLQLEHILCTIKYDQHRGLLLIYPDFTTLAPYHIQIDSQCKRIFQYYIENASETATLDILLKEAEILNKIASHQARLKLQNTNFTLPPKNKLNVHLFFEILTARNFEYNDIYVQYFIDLPENWYCTDSASLKGSTQTSHSDKNDNLSYFGFPFEVGLVYDIQPFSEQDFCKAPCIYLEVISKDSWDRFRTEGLTYTLLPVYKPGIYNYELRCLRFCSKDPYGSLKRFFIGDCSNCNDLTWISIPKGYDDVVLNKYGWDTVSTGNVELRINIVHHSQDYISNEKNDKCDMHRSGILKNLNQSNLVKSIEQVVAAFKVAKKKMIEARKNVHHLKD